jgi:hypothetical protein
MLLLRDAFMIACATNPIELYLVASSAYYVCYEQSKETHILLAVVFIESSNYCASQS